MTRSVNEYRVKYVRFWTQFWKKNEMNITYEAFGCEELHPKNTLSYSKRHFQKFFKIFFHHLMWDKQFSKTKY